MQLKFLLVLIIQHKPPFRIMCEITKGLIRENIISTNVPNRRSRVERLTAFYKDLSDIYVKYVDDQLLNQPYHDTRSWYHRTAASIEWSQASRSGAFGTCSKARKLFVKPVTIVRSTVHAWWAWLWIELSSLKHWQRLLYFVLKKDILLYTFSSPLNCINGYLVNRTVG